MTQEKKNTLQIDASKLPEGMTAEGLIALVKSAAARAETGEKQRKVRSYAVNKLTKKYAGEYEAARQEAIAKYEAGDL